MAKLLVQESAGVREFELSKEETTIGRGKANLLRLSHPSISNRHCVVRRTDSGFEVEDLNSSNGVLLNAKRIQNGTLKDGDRMDLGEIRLTFKDSKPAAGAATVALLPGPPRVTIRMSAEALAEHHARHAHLPLPHPAGEKDSGVVAKILAGHGVGANLRGVNLRGADLAGAQLERADLSEADLSGANLKAANLSGATLNGANLASANLWGANLERASLRKANLTAATMTAANLEGAILEGALQ